MSEQPFFPDALGAPRPVILAEGASARIERLIASRQIDIAFQPFIDVMSHSIHGYEALGRPPKSAGFSDISELLTIASAANCRLELECHLVTRAIDRFATLGLTGRLFVNLSPECLGHPGFSIEDLLTDLQNHSLSYTRLVIELTEQQCSVFPHVLQSNLDRLRKLGIALALDDFAAGYNGMLHWMDQQPEIVKIDRKMLSDIDKLPKKYRFVRSVVHLAKESGAHVIAEGIENPSEAGVLAELGVDFLQGYLFGRPESEPLQAIEPETLGHLKQYRQSQLTQKGLIRTLIQPAQSVQHTTRLDTVMNLFLSHPELRALPVLDGEFPVGIAWRHDLMNLYASPYGRPLNERRSISRLMDRRPVIVDESESLTLLSRRISERDHRSFHDVFIITRGRAYAGVGQLIDLLRLYTTQQVRQAQHLNPLSGLPGNVPLNETLETWLNEQRAFTLVYVDLDHFKAINDHYGYQRGDQVLLMLSQILKDCTHPASDFLGHVGGDDFVILYRTADWRARCGEIIALFDAKIPAFYDPQDQIRGYIDSADRDGNPKQYPLCSITLAALDIVGTQAPGSHALTEQVSAIKLRAKKHVGSNLLIESLKSDIRSPAHVI